MGVTIVGTIKNAGEETLNGTVYVTANRSFFDADGEFHIKDVPFTSEILDGEMEIELPATIKYSYTAATLTDDGNVLTFTSILDGTDGNDLTITIEDGSVGGSKITITDGTTPEVYDNVDMDETGGSYILDAINGVSSYVTVARLTALDVDTLPTNQSATNMTGGADTNLVKPTTNGTLKYNFKFVDEYNNTYIMVNNIQVTYSASNINFYDLI